MNNLMAGTAVILITASCPAFAQSVIEQTLDFYIVEANKNGKVEYSSKDSGLGYVEYKDVVIASPGKELEITAPWMRAADLEGGLAELSFPAEIQVSFRENESAPASTFTLSSENLVLTTNTIVMDPTTLSTVHVDIVSDSLSLTNFTSVIPEVLRELSFLQTNGKLSFDLDLATMKSSGGWSADALEVAYEFSIEGQTQKAVSAASDFDLTFDLDVPQGEYDFPSYINGTKNAVIKMTSGPASGSGSFADQNMALSYAGTGEGSEIEMSIVGGNLLYLVRTGAVDYTITPDGMPIEPVAVSMSEMLMNVAMPFGSTTEPSEANMTVKLADLVVGDSAWALFDPGATLPREPINVDVNVSANVQFAEDVIMASQMNPMAAVKISDATINSFLIELAGAKATADGALTFDPNMPMPVPTGKVTVMLDGVTTLAQKLVDLGLVPAGNVAQFSAMLPMFAKEVGTDSYTSDIEFNGMQGVTVNGLQIPM